MRCLEMFIDFSKDFYTLSYNRLIEVLQKNDIRGRTLQWFTNYLECKTNRVNKNNGLSKELLTGYGVPQGFKLGSELYMLYSNEMLNFLQNSKTFVYPDDTAPTAPNENINNGIKTVENKFDMATKWCHDNGMVINAQKRG